MKATKGFSIIELLSVMAIVGLLAAVAIPQYTDYVIRGKIAEAFSTLSDGRVKMEQFFQDNKTYVGGPTPAATTYFTYSSGTPTATTYTLTATGTGNVAGFTYTIDQNNVKATTAAPSGWPTSTTCWTKRKSGC